jgi:hypothetical protein
MRKIVEHFEGHWGDTKFATDEGYLSKMQATFMIEAAFNLIRHQEEALVRDAQEKGLKSFYFSLDNDDFFSNTAKSHSKIEAEQKARGAGHIFLVSRLSP